ncbi:MAG: hypothetical protein ACPGPF_00105 [Pontibacterium sp.]
MPTEIVISSEQDAIDLLNDIHGEKLSANDLSIKFDGWPKVDFHIKGDKYHQSITPALMNAFIEMQRGVNRAYTVAKYGSYNVSQLTDVDKKKLEIAVSVGDGSSIFGLDFQEILENFLSGAVSKMTSKELIFLVVTLGLMYAGDSAYKAYLQDRKDARELEAQIKEQESNLTNLQFMSEKETERLKIVATIAQTHAAVDNVQRHAFDTATELFKRAATADSIEIGNAEISGEIAKKLTRNAKRKSEDVRLDGDYRILEVNSSLAKGFKVKIRNISNSMVFTASFKDGVLNDRVRATLADAEWSKIPVKLVINGKDLSGQITKAEVFDVQRLDQAEIDKYLQQTGRLEKADNSDEDDT